VITIGVVMMTVLFVMAVANVSEPCDVNVRPSVMIGRLGAVCMRVRERRHLSNDKSEHHNNRYASAQHRFLGTHFSLTALTVSSNAAGKRWRHWLCGRLGFY
jgi:hypothetical protein